MNIKSDNKIKHKEICIYFNFEYINIIVVNLVAVLVLTFILKKEIFNV